MLLFNVVSLLGKVFIMDLYLFFVIHKKRKKRKSVLRYMFKKLYLIELIFTGGLHAWGNFLTHFFTSFQKKNVLIFHTKKEENICMLKSFFPDKWRRRKELMIAYKKNNNENSFLYVRIMGWNNFMLSKIKSCNVYLKLNFT